MHCCYSAGMKKVARKLCNILCRYSLCYRDKTWFAELSDKGTFSLFCCYYVYVCIMPLRLSMCEYVCILWLMHTIYGKCGHCVYIRVCMFVSVCICMCLQISVCMGVRTCVNILVCMCMHDYMYFC